MNEKDIKIKLIERDGLRCSTTGEKIDDPDKLKIHHIKPLSEGGTEDLDNLVLVSTNYRKDSESRKLGALAGGAILGASLFGPAGAIIGGLTALMIGNPIIDGRKDKSNG